MLRHFLVKCAFILLTFTNCRYLKNNKLESSTICHVSNRESLHANKDLFRLLVICACVRHTKKFQKKVQHIHSFVNLFFSIRCILVRHLVDPKTISATGHKRIHPVNGIAVAAWHHEHVKLK